MNECSQEICVNQIYDVQPGNILGHPFVSVGLGKFEGRCYPAAKEKCKAWKEAVCVILPESYASNARTK